MTKIFKKYYKSAVKIFLLCIFIAVFSFLNFISHDFQINKAQAATTGAKYPTLGETILEAPWSDNTWVTPTNIYADDAATANVTAATYDLNDQTFVLKATGFDFSAIPDDSIIDGVIVRVNAWYRAGQGSGSMDLCQLLNSSKAKVGTNQCATPVPLTTTNTTIITKGSSTDTWGNALTSDWIKSANFGVAIGVLATANNADVDIDYVTVEIYYTPPTPPDFSVAPADIIFSNGSPNLDDDMTITATIHNNGGTWTGNTSTLNTYYDNTNGASQDANYSIYASQWLAQSFTPASTITISKVSLYIRCSTTNYNQNCGPLTVRLQTDSGGLPSGISLATTTLPNGSALNTSSWVDVNFPEYPTLTGSTKYWIVTEGVRNSIDLGYAWATDNTTPTYTGGNLAYSIGSGQPWSNTPYNSWFRVYGGDKAPILVKFFDGDPDVSGTQISTTQVITSLAGSATSDVQVTWAAGAAGAHNIYVHVDRDNKITESNETNNKAYKAITVSDTTPSAPTTLYVGYPSAQSGSTNPTEVTAGTPMFSAVNNHGKAVTAFQIQLTLSTDTGYASPIWSSGDITGMTSTVSGIRTPDIPYGIGNAPTGLLQAGQNYIWRFRTKSAYYSAWSSNGTIGMASTGSFTARFYEDKDTSYGTVYEKGGQPDRATMYSGGWGDTYYSYLEWGNINLGPSVADTTAANLYLYNNGGLRPNNPNIYVRIITQSWDEYNTYCGAGCTTYTPSTAPSFTTTDQVLMPNPPAGWSATNITNIYNNWKNATFTNYGIILHPTTTGADSNGTFYTSDSGYYGWYVYYPYLEINYAAASIVPILDQTHYRFRNDDGNEGTTAGWYSTWDYRKQITIDYTEVASNLTDFPVLISFNADPDLSTYAQADGDDILFTSSDGTTKLSHEIEKYVAGTGELVAWVKTDLSSTVNTTLYMYYGESYVGSQQNASAVWDAGYKMVQHLEEVSGAGAYLLDSTTNTNNGNPLSPTFTSSAEIDGGRVFNGTSDYITVTDNASLDITQNLTISAWVYINSWSDWARVISKKSTANDGYEMLLGDAGRYIRFETGNTAVTRVADSAANSINTGAWHHVAAVFDRTGTTAYVYVNGSQSGAPPTWTTDTAANAYDVNIGRRTSAATNYFLGTIDEARISNVARTAAWISTEYNNQKPSASFFSVGAAVSSEKATWKAAEDTATTTDKDINIRLRFSVKNTGATANSYNYRLQYSTLSAANCEAEPTGNFADVPTTAGGAVIMASSAYVADNSATTRQLSIPTFLTFASGKFVALPSNQTAAFNLSGNYFTEFEYAFKFTDNALPNTNYCFRLKNDGVSVLDSYTKVAKITTGDWVGSVTLNQNHYRFRDDSVTLDTDSGWLAAQDSIYNPLIKNVLTRLRVEIANTGSLAVDSYNYRLQSALRNGAACGDDETFTDVPVTATIEHWEMVGSSQYIDDESITVSRLTATGTFVNGKAVEDPSNQTTAFSLNNGNYTEFEYAIQATTNAVNSGAYCFRVTNAGSIINFTYSLYPQITFSFLPATGNLSSVVFDTGVAKPAYNSIFWKGTQFGGKVRFKIAASDDPAGPWTDEYFIGNDWVNPCGSAFWYEPSEPNIPIEIGCFSNFNNKRYFKYKVQLCSSSDCVTPGTQSPIVTDVIINWSP